MNKDVRMHKKISKKIDNVFSKLSRLSKDK